MPKDPATGRFAGFQSPNYTPVPDELFDDLLADLSGAELKVLLYIIRKTFGWKKDSDNISLAQMLNGVRTRDGRVQDRGVGLTKKTLLGAINSLEGQGIILTERRRSQERGDEPTTYRLNVAGMATPENTGENSGRIIATPPVGEKLPQGGGAQITPGAWGKNYPTQETLEQEILIQETNTSNIRKVPTQNKRGSDGGRSAQKGSVSTIRPANISDIQGRGDISQQVPIPEQNDASTAIENQGDMSSADRGTVRLGDALIQRRRGRPSADEAEARRVIRQYVEDFGRELGDQAPKSSVTRATNLMQEAGVSLGLFIGALQDAKKTTQKRSAGIQKQGTGGGLSQKNKMAYFFSVLEDQLGLRAQAVKDTATTERAN